MANRNIFVIGASAGGIRALAAASQITSTGLRCSCADCVVYLPDMSGACCRRSCRAGKLLNRDQR